MPQTIRWVSHIPFTSTEVGLHRQVALPSTAADLRQGPGSAGVSIDLSLSGRPSLVSTLGSSARATPHRRVRWIRSAEGPLPRTSTWAARYARTRARVRVIRVHRRGQALRPPVVGISDSPMDLCPSHRGSHPLLTVVSEYINGTTPTVCFCIWGPHIITSKLGDCAI